MEGQLVESPQISVLEFNLCKNAAELLHKHYPGHLWAVSINGSVLDVRNLFLSGEWGFRLHVPAIYSSSDWDKRIITAGGEILERYKHRRGVVHEGHIHDLPTDFSGRHKPEL
jgi:hypothetical protein